MARKRSSRTKKSYSKTKKQYSKKKKNISRSRKSSYRKKGGTNQWEGSEYPPGSRSVRELNQTMGVPDPSFQEQAPYGPLSECQSLECKKRRAEVSLETAKEELERITLELNDARDRERMNQLLLPLQNAYNEISSITSNAVSYSSKKLSKEGKRLGVKGKRAIGKTAAKTAKRLASLAAANLPLTPEDRGRLLGFKQSAERFDRSLDN